MEREELGEKNQFWSWKNGPQANNLYMELFASISTLF